MPFPQEFPKDAMQGVIHYLRGLGQKDTKKLVEDCYDVLGYGLFLGFGTTHGLIAATVPVSLVEKAEALEATMLTAAGPNVQWRLIIGIVLDLLKEYLNKS